jgi:mannose-6-phosphate isomerase-like protein (cupin superfamily)
LTYNNALAAARARYPVMLEQVTHNEQLLAIILRHDFAGDGVHFLTPHDLSQQLAYMHHPRGKVIEPHVHNVVQRNISYTQEVLIIKRGRLRVDFYGSDRAYLHSRILTGGDVILLATGGHGFEVLEELEMIEVKQGPYTGDADKSRFAAVPSHSIRVVDPVPAK